MGRQKATLSTRQRSMVIIIFVAVLLLWTANLFVLPCLGICDVADQGQFGDKFGAVNALFSALAFAGVILTVFLQKEELCEQRKELILTREEIKGQKEQLRAQNETMKLQSFETSFFNLIALLNGQIAGMRTSAGATEPDVVGRNCFDIWFSKWHNADGNRKGKHPEKSAIELLELAYNDCNLDPQVGFFFRTFYHVVNFADTSDVPCPARYIAILRAQLSSSQIAMLFWNSILPRGEKLKPLVNKYALLKHWNAPPYLAVDNYKSEYESSAFGEVKQRA